MIFSIMSDALFFFCHHILEGIIWLSLGYNQANDVYSHYTLFVSLG